MNRLVAKQWKPRRLYRCRNCGIRVTKRERVMPWKACSEDCADEIWIKANFKAETRAERKAKSLHLYD